MIECEVPCRTSVVTIASRDFLDSFIGVDNKK